jgi:DNA-binding transcriptional LysR family regulator
MVSPGVELRTIRIFLVLAEELHFGRTAERVGLTPSRVSQTLQALEGHVGGPLFARTSRRVALTALGEQLRDRLAPAYAELDAALTAARANSVGVTGPVRIGMYHPMTVGPYFFEIVAHFRATHPRAAVDIIETGLRNNPLDSLRTGEVELLAMRLPLADADLVIGPRLGREPRVLLVASHHPLASLDSVCYEDLADYCVSDVANMPREMMDEFIPPRTPSGRLLQRSMNHSTTDAIIRVATGEIVHPTVPSFVDFIGEPGLTTIPIRDLPPSETALVWLAARGDHPSIRAFVSAAETVMNRVA